MSAARRILFFSGVALAILFIALAVWSWLITGVWMGDETVARGTRLEIAKLALTTTGGLGAVVAVVSAFDSVLDASLKRERRELDAALDLLQNPVTADNGLSALIEIAERSSNRVSKAAFSQLCALVRRQRNNGANNGHSLANKALAAIISNLKPSKPGRRDGLWSRWKLDLHGAVLPKCGNAWEGTVFGPASFRRTVFPVEAVSFTGATIRRRSILSWVFKGPFSGAMFRRNVRPPSSLCLSRAVKAAKIATGYTFLEPVQATSSKSRRQLTQ